MIGSAILGAFWALFILVTTKDSELSTWAFWIVFTIAFLRRWWEEAQAERDANED